MLVRVCFGCVFMIVQLLGNPRLRLCTAMQVVCLSAMLVGAMGCIQIWAEAGVASGLAHCRGRVLTSIGA